MLPRPGPGVACHSHDGCRAVHACLPVVWLFSVSSRDLGFGVLMHLKPLPSLWRAVVCGDAAVGNRIAQLLDCLLQLE